ncbi:MAG: hypothetical protein WC352_03250 [Candidatus Omnitrophota bacterium]|jgi:hypothetical protein
MTTPAASCLNFEEFEKQGFYLVFDDKTRVFMDQETVRAFARDYFDDTSKVPASVKQCVDFSRCDVCPEKETPGFCHAILPSLLFFESAEKYLSFSDVLVVVKVKRPEMEHAVFHAARTTMQQALKYVSVYSLMYYCEVGRDYWKFFTGIDPLLPVSKIAARLYLNIYWYYRGNEAEVRRVIAEFQEKIQATSQCQIKRLRLICKSDALLNALVLAQIITELLKVQGDRALRQAMDTPLEKPIATPNQKA